MQVESKIMEQVKSVLSNFGNKYIDNNGVLKRNMVIEDLNHYPLGTLRIPRVHFKVNKKRLCK